MGAFTTRLGFVLLAGTLAPPAVRPLAWREQPLAAERLAAERLTAERFAPGRLTIDALIDIKYPSEAAWSPDGEAIAYLWDRAGVQNIWLVTPGKPPAALTAFDTDLIESLAWNADGDALLFVRQGRLMRVPRDGGAPQPVWPGGAPVGDMAVSPDRSRVAFVRGGELYVQALAGGTGRQLTRGTGGVSGPTWSPDGTHVAFTFARSSRREETLYTAKVVFTRIDRDPSRVGVVSPSSGEIIRLRAWPGGEESPRWLDNGRLVLQRMSADLKERDVVVADVRSGAERVLRRDQDEKFWSLTFLNAEPLPSPDGKWVAFVSDADGWDHLYVESVADGTLTQVTRGTFEVSRAAWSPDSASLVFDRSDAEHPGTRQIVVATRDGTWAAPRLDAITSGRGTNTNARWSPDGKRVLFEHTDARNAPDFYVADATAGAETRRLTDSMPPAIDRSALVEPEFVRYPAPDGAQVPAYLFAPPGLDRTRKHPAVIWVHGDGINQNYDGWHIHRDYGVYYSFHQYLLQQGYVVLAVDYRGSIGYGRNWRQGHYRDLGGKDYGDIAAGAAYLKTLGYVDTDHVGIWGLSYGGFMALQALTVTPDLFRCAVDVAGVEDWNDWYRDPGGPWIRARMGRPEDDPALYRRLSPIYHVNEITRPLLVLHGTSDVNVPFFESVRLIDALKRAGKPVEFVMYPGEFHYFHSAHVLHDAWAEVERFFAGHLIPH
jgi:dipeptidyl aminopeptidase/acylaminoacyl peptidase